MSIRITFLQNHSLNNRHLTNVHLLVQIYQCLQFPLGMQHSEHTADRITKQPQQTHTMPELEQPGTSGLKRALPEPAAKFKRQKVQKIDKTMKLPQLTHTLANPEPGTSGLKRPLPLQQSAAKIKKQKVQKKKRGPKKE
jgi:hypothetical protein